MYAKIALRNMRRSVRDYGVYFATLVIGVCMFYAFNSITQQSAVLGLSDAANKTLGLVGELIGGVSVFLAVILGFLVVYANNFLIHRRKREFAIYATLGMGQGQVSKIIVFETLIVGLVSLAVGLVLGYFLSQLLLLVTAALFDVKMSMFVFFFSPEAAGMTVLCFAVMFAISLVFNVFTVSRCRLIDLLNAGRKNETVTLHNLPLSLVLMVAAIACIGAAYQTLLANGLTQLDGEFVKATVLVVVGTFLFFYSLSGVLLRVTQGCKSVYLKNLRMFTLRQLNARVNTAWVSISLVCLVLFLALTSSCGGFSIVSAFNKDIEEATVYDASYSVSYGSAAMQGAAAAAAAAAADDGYDMNRAFSRDVAGWNGLVSKTAQIDFYESDVLSGVAIDGSDYKLPSAFSVDYMRQVPLEVVSLSQLNAVRSLQGLDPVRLGDDEYLIWCDYAQMKPFWKSFESKGGALTLYGANLHPAADGLDETITQTAAMPENTGVIVVPDDLIPANAPRAVSTLDVMFDGSRDAIDAPLRAAVAAAYGSDADGWPFTIGATAYEMREQSVGMTAIISYLAIYIGIILLITCAAILALQQLSEAADNVARYALIEKLGAEQSMVDHALYQQIGIYFIFPLLLALCHSACAMTVVADTVQVIGYLDIRGPLALTALLAVAVYGGYYLVTCAVSKGMIRLKR